MEASNLFSLFQIPYHSWISISTMFGYKLSTPQPLLETMYMYDIVFQYKELGEILKKENGDSDGDNTYQNKVEEYQNNMKTQMDSYKSQMNMSVPNLSSGNLGNIGNLTSGFKMPKIG